MSLEFEKINLNQYKDFLNNGKEQIKITSTNHTSQKYQGYENLKSELMEDYSDMEMEMKGMSIPVEVEISQDRDEN
jgi:hypothetical protein